MVIQLEDKAYSLLGELVERMMRRWEVAERTLRARANGQGLHHAAHLTVHTDAANGPPPLDEAGLALAARCYLKLGQWREAMLAEAKNAPGPALSEAAAMEAEEAGIREALGFYETARDCNRDWYKAWHALAAVNFTAHLHYKEKARRAKAAARIRPSPTNSVPTSLDQLPVPVHSNSANTHHTPPVLPSAQASAPDLQYAASSCSPSQSKGHGHRELDEPAPPPQPVVPGIPTPPLPLPINVPAQTHHLPIHPASNFQSPVRHFPILFL